jgi:multisubunit Na+/H+ antiporter MnhB subunit
MTAVLLSSIVAIVLSLLFSYVPGLNTWYAALTGEWKRVGMAVLLLLTAGAVFGLSCANVLSYVTCDQAGAIGMIKIFVSALIANQAAFLITPQTTSVKTVNAGGVIPAPVNPEIPEK